MLAVVSKWSLLLDGCLKTTELMLGVNYVAYVFKLYQFLISLWCGLIFCKLFKRQICLFTLQAALAIRDLGIRGFDSSEIQKPRKARENCYL